MTKRRKRGRITVGAISEGTLQPIDLAESYLYELKRIEGNTQRVRDFTREWDHLSQHEDHSALCDGLRDALESLAPDYLYFGATGGDGACIGWWPDWTCLETNPYGTLGKGDTLPTANKSAPDHFLVVNDHGNSTLYRRANNRWIEVWGCV